MEAVETRLAHLEGGLRRGRIAAAVLASVVLIAAAAPQDLRQDMQVSSVKILGFFREERAPLDFNGLHLYDWQLPERALVSAAGLSFYDRKEWDELCRSSWHRRGGAPDP